MNLCHAIIKEALEEWYVQPWAAALLLIGGGEAFLGGFTSPLWTTDCMCLEVIMSIFIIFLLMLFFSSENVVDGGGRAYSTVRNPGWSCRNITECACVCSCMRIHSIRWKEIKLTPGTRACHRVLKGFPYLRGFSEPAWATIYQLAVYGFVEMVSTSPEAMDF